MIRLQQFYLLFLLLIFCSCTDQKNPAPGNDTAGTIHLTDTTKTTGSHTDSIHIMASDTADDWQKFNSLFRDTLGDTLLLFVYEQWIEKIDQEVHLSISKEKFNENRTFKGTIIPPAQKHWVKNPDTEYGVEPQYHACYRIQLGLSQTAFLVRIYSPASPQTVNFLYLFFFDEQHRLVDKMRVAALTSDDASSSTEQSWILDSNGDGQKEIVTLTQVTNYENDPEEVITNLGAYQLNETGKFTMNKSLIKPSMKKKFHFRENGVIEHYPAGR